MNGYKTTGATVCGGTMIVLYGLWGLVAALVVAVFTHLPELTDMLKVIFAHRDFRWTHDDPHHTNRVIATHNGVPIDLRGQTPTPLTRPPQLGQPPAASPTSGRPRPCPGPGPWPREGPGRCAADRRVSGLM